MNSTVPCLIKIEAELYTVLTTHFPLHNHSTNSELQSSRVHNNRSSSQWKTKQPAPPAEASQAREASCYPKERGLAFTGTRSGWINLYFCLNVGLASVLHGLAETTESCATVIPTAAIQGRALSITVTLMSAIDFPVHTSKP